MKLESLERGHYYHIYNRGINSCDIFKNTNNFDFFIQLFSKYLEKHISVFAYCLLRNHFHFVIRVDSEPKIVTQHLSNFFNAYAKAFNKQQNRTGSLFEKHFKRIKIQSENYLKNIILYVHTNPVKHHIIDDFKKYKHSSYHIVLINNSTLINVNEVIGLFYDLENFKFVHQYVNDSLTEKYTFE